MAETPKPPPPNEAQAPAVAQRTRRDARTRRRHKPLPPYHVILLDDDDHTYEYVVCMLGDLFAYPRARGWDIARIVDKQGKAIVFTAHKELAELKRDQIHSYGAHHHLLSSVGPMRALIVPADEEA